MSSVNKDYSEEEVCGLLLGTFQAVFADLIIVYGKKPAEILFELEAVLSHIAVARTHPEETQENLNNAMRHMQRATLDAVKMLWLEYGRKIEDVLPEPQLRKYVLNCRDDEFVKQSFIALNLAQKARHIELENLGRNPFASIKPYHEAAMAIREAYSLIDLEKVSSFFLLQSRYIVERHWPGFLVGVASSGVVAVVVWLIPS